MRIQFRGGVWKNSEDEILKAAVMKYGMNQWARIASLLGRKSATQCKARWYEWLDPAIKKTPWTREEEEKLLHLVKVMPTSWRTIAPMIGRTAAQCIEHYEELIDQAQQGDGADGSKPGSASFGSAAAFSSRGRPGDTDAAPESKPARPDPVDMDEDELEMLSEARARLANTKGKKAKRKAREKQLEVAKRLALLQKRRELKAAGIDVKLFRKKKNVTDYGTEIPFERKPVAGFFDTSEEDASLEKQADQKAQIGKLLQKYKGKTAAEKEEEAQKRDRAKRKELEKTNLPAALGLERVRAPRSPPLKKARLSLPPPQLSDLELAKLSKSQNGRLAKSNSAKTSKSAKPPSANGTNTASNTLNGVGPESNPARFTPEPWAVARNRQLQTLIDLKSVGTPLRGGPNPDVQQLGLGGRVTPAPSELRTPNPLATPLMTPGSVYGTNTKSGPPADRKSILAELVKRGFRNLPEPENEYEIDVASDAASDDENTNLSSEPEGEEMDVEDEARQRMNGKRSLLESERTRLLSSAARRDLPTPRTVTESDELAEELIFLINRDKEYHQLLEEEQENGGIVTVSMLDRLQDLTDHDHLTQKEMSRGIDLINEEIVKDGPLAFDFQDTLLEVLKTRAMQSMENEKGFAEETKRNANLEPELELERNERRRVLESLHEKTLEDKRVTRNDLYTLQELREKFVGEKDIIPEAKEATNEKTIVDLIRDLKEKQRS
ncbi:Myb-like DNA-binding protein [Gracilaria domingensis]|nr:Myb-like DNA-binding protein [Gracilaria domingensis]